MKVSSLFCVNSFLVKDLWRSRGVNDDDREEQKSKFVKELQIVKSKENVTKIIH